MSGTPYIDGDTLDECREAMRQGHSLESLAGKLQCSPEHLARLLGSPALRPIPVDDSCDLWADEEKLESVL